MGLTVFDTGVLIAYLDAQDVHHTSATEAVVAARDQGHRLSVPVSCFAELLVRPLQEGPDTILAVEEAVRRLPLDVVPLDQSIAVGAADLRAEHGRRLRLPDALVVATARRLDADLLVTTDRNWPTPTAIGLEGRVHVI